MDQQRKDTQKKVAATCSVASLLLLMTGCEDPDLSQRWHEQMLTIGNYHEVHLYEWWSDESIQASEVRGDPLGGLLLLYWIDDAGNACHGIPGVSGQPGPFVIKAYSEDLLFFIRSNPDPRLSDVTQYQKIAVSTQGLAKGDLYLVQFDNLFWRIRDTNELFIDSNNHWFSKPEVISLDEQICLTPVGGASDCCHAQLGFPLPEADIDSTPEPPLQDPDRCRTRILPQSASMAAEDLLRLSLVTIPNGLLFTY